MSEFDQLFKQESGRILATLIRILGDFDTAEEALQEAFLAALQQWPLEGKPKNPVSWLISTARNRAVDKIRRDARLSFLLVKISPLLESQSSFGLTDGDETVIEDDRLRLIFTCCHPALAMEFRVALTLRTVCGLSPAQIARHFLMSEAAMGQRLLRAKQKIQGAQIPYRVPHDSLLDERIAVLGFDPESRVYIHHDFNSRGETEASKGTVQGDTWTWLSNESMAGKMMKGRFTIRELSPTSFTFKFEMAPEEGE